MDDVVQSAERLADPLHDVGHLLLVTQVQGAWPRFPALGRQEVGDPAHVAAGASGDGHRGPQPPEEQGSGSADAAATADDERHVTVQTGSVEPGEGCHRDQPLRASAVVRKGRVIPTKAAGSALGYRWPACGTVASRRSGRAALRARRVARQGDRLPYTA